MGQAVGQVLSFAVGVALSPIPIIGVVLMLGTPRARSNGPAFIAGWIAGLSVVGTVALLVSSGASASKHGQPADWVNWLKLVLGLLLLVVAVRQWRGRPRGDAQAALPSWMKSIDRFTAVRAAVFGVVLSAAIAQTGVSTGKQAVALAVFVLIGSIGTGAPVVLYFALGDRSKRLLDELKSWMAQHNAAIMLMLCLVIGAKLIGDAISGFAA
jgi:hypothetical protein